MPIGPPSHWPAPKSGWRPVERPIDAMIVDESAATGSVSTRWFHALFAGKIGHFGAAGTRSALAVAAQGSNASRLTVALMGRAEALPRLRFRRLRGSETRSTRRAARRARGRWRARAR